ncbi:MAG: PIG-L family deacetylase [Actinomycetota bacterium]|nr:PIG-L family deacetylase [Actinomycetota bacterium]
MLAIGAHSDDVEFGCGGTLAKWAAAGAAVHLLVLTDGSKGTWDPDADLAALVATRRREQEAAASVLGLTGVEILDVPDGELQSGLAERGLVAAAIRRIRPDVVLGHDPWKRYRLHPDHRHAGWLVIDGVVAARDHHYFPEQGLPAHRPERILLFEAELVDHLERVDQELDAKARALLSHRSQWRSTMRIDPEGPDRAAEQAAFEARVRGEADQAGRGAGIGPAEGFKLIDKV